MGVCISMEKRNIYIVAFLIFQDHLSQDRVKVSNDTRFMLTACNSPRNENI